MRNFHRALLAGSLSLVVGFVTGCGGSGAGLLTGSQASALQNQLNQVSSALGAGHCADVQTATRSLAGQVASLPGTVNANLRQALISEANQVINLSDSQCHPVSTTTTTQSTPTTTATTTTTPTTHTTTTTTTTTNTNTTPTNTNTTPATTTTTTGTNSGGGGLTGGSGGLPGTGGGASNGNGNGQ
ncbi:MAG TPA: hypothetical protein VMD09_08660 [Solirubrobacteraceae bacterium]|nr:hypothetical protein [Solirubrobacteraceae bacterium]